MNIIVFVKVIGFMELAVVIQWRLDQWHLSPLTYVHAIFGWVIFVIAVDENFMLRQASSSGISDPTYIISSGFVFSWQVILNKVGPPY